MIARLKASRPDPTIPGARRLQPSVLHLAAAAMGAALGAVLAKRFGIAAAQDLVPWHPTLGDVDSAQALADYQAAKRLHKAEWSKAQTPA